MIADMTDIFSEISVSADFKTRRIIISEFGKPTFRETVETYSVAIVESKVYDQKIVSEIPVQFSALSVWIDRSSIPKIEHLLNSVFEYEGSSYEILGLENRGGRSSHIQYFAVNRVDE